MMGPLLGRPGGIFLGMLYPWAVPAPRGERLHGAHHSRSEGAPSSPAASASAAPAAGWGLQPDRAAATAPRPALGQPGAVSRPGAQIPLAELVRQHGPPMVDADLFVDEGVTTMAIMNVPYKYRLGPS